MTNPDNVGGLQSATKLRMLIGQYWDIAYAEGREGRQTDNEDGDAARVALEIEQTIGELCRAAPAGGDTDHACWEEGYKAGFHDAKIGHDHAAPAGSGEVEEMAQRLEERAKWFRDGNDDSTLLRTAAALLRKLQQGAE